MCLCVVGFQNGLRTMKVNLGVVSGYLYLLVDHVSY